MTIEPSTKNPVAALRERMAESMLYAAQKAELTVLERFMVYNALREWALVNECTNAAAEKISIAKDRTEGQLELIKTFNATICGDSEAMWRTLCRKCGRDPLAESIILYGLDMTDWEKTATDQYPGYLVLFERIFRGEPPPKARKNGPR